MENYLNLDLITNECDIVNEDSSSKTRENEVVYKDIRKTCSVPLNHFGPIPGIEVGMCWKYRDQLSKAGVHRLPVSGFHGRSLDGAYSIVLGGLYKDGYDNGYEFTYNGSGGRYLSRDQTLTGPNMALARNCAVNPLNEDGADAGDAWKSGLPVRIVRSYRMPKRFPTYAPKEGYRYDGVYKVVKYYPEKGLSGYNVWKYLLRRDDPNPAPWEPEAKQFPVIWPDGSQEARAEKEVVAPKKRTEKETNSATLKKGNKRKNDSPITVSDDDDTIMMPKRRRGIYRTHKARVSLYNVPRCRSNPGHHALFPQLCMVCLKVALKSSRQCPRCRKNISDAELTLNDELKNALKMFLPGYDAGEK
ncbi:unnamed protein product [Leptosia nina]|uniref:YDG domain-containing protein n=1 Tax=Leptosia nina TaxID=320188 RepID=A0AAV1K0R2_9NEOP